MGFAEVSEQALDVLADNPLQWTEAVLAGNKEEALRLIRDPLLDWIMNVVAYSNTEFDLVSDTSLEFNWAEAVSNEGGTMQEYLWMGLLHAMAKYLIENRWDDLASMVE